MSSQRTANSDAKAASGRSRPTNNQLLYKAYLRWDHYSHKLRGNPQLPAETEACASVTSAFLQVMSILFEVESLRVENPRNILQMLSTNTRRTKVVELSSGTHRVPDELRRHSLNDGVGGQYSTNLDRNRYGADDQYLSTVIRYDLEFLRLCPCLVDVEIIDAKNGSGTILVSAGEDFCICTKDPARKAKDADAVVAKAQQSVSVVPWPTAEAARGQPSVRSPTAAVAAAAAAAAAAGVRPNLGDPAVAAAIAAARADPNAAAKSGGSDLFDALLMAAGAPQLAGGIKGQPQQAAAAAALAAAAAVEEGQVCSKPAVWPVPQPAVKRQRSRLYQSPNAPSDLLTSPAPVDVSAQNKALQGARKGSSSALNALSPTPDAATRPVPPPLGKERSGENGPNTNNDSLVQSIMEGIDQDSLDAMDLGDLEGQDPESLRASLRQANGDPAPASANGAGNMAGMPRAYKDSELRRLEEEVKSLKAGRAEMEARVEEARAKESAAIAAANALRSDLGLPVPPSQASQADDKKGQVLGQQTWELAKERLAQRAQVQVPRMVSVLRLEVQRLNMARQQAEAARAAAEERATASQAVAESLQRDLNNAMAASNGPHAQHARAVVDAENKGLRAQLEEARAALRRVEAERAALEECLAVTTSVSAPLPAMSMSMSLQPAPVTPQPHRNANPTSDLSDSEKQPSQATSPEKAAVQLALAGREGSHTPPNSTTPNKTTPQLPAVAPSQAPLVAARQPTQQVAKQSSPPAEQAVSASASGAIVTPTGEESNKRKRCEDDNSAAPSPSNCAHAPVASPGQAAGEGLLAADAAAAFMAMPPQNQVVADAQAAVAAIAAAKPGATPQDIINAAIIVSQRMAAAVAAAAAAPASGAPATAAAAYGVPMGSPAGFWQQPGAMSLDAVSAIAAGVPSSFNGAGQAPQQEASVKPGPGPESLPNGVAEEKNTVQESAGAGSGAGDAGDAADFDVDQMLAPQAGMTPPVMGSA